MLDGRQGRLAVTSDVVERLEKASDPGWFESLVTLNHDGEERYMATLDIFHEVHCLVSPGYVSSFNRHSAHEWQNMLRKASHFEHYVDHDPRKIHGHLGQSHRSSSKERILLTRSLFVMQTIALRLYDNP